MNTPENSPEPTPVATSYWAIVPAAGSGKRMGAGKPKQYLPLAGKPLIAHTLENILQWPGLTGVVVAIAADDREFEHLAAAQDFRVHTVTGGAERADSVLAALNFLSERADPETLVLVHDAARPLVSRKDIESLLAAGATALLAQPASDTIKQSRDKNGEPAVERTLSRERIWLAQTPQKAPLAVLHEALKTSLAQAPETITDEASALEMAGYHPQLVPACRSNFKITHPADLILAEALLQHRQTLEKIQSGTDT